MFGGSGPSGGFSFGGNNNAQQQQPAGGGLFGGAQQQPQQQNNPFGGGGAAGGAFGAPAGGGGLFGGGAQQPQQSGSLFGGAQQNQQQQPSSFTFGQNQNQQQPAASGAFGAPRPAGTSFGGGFGNTANNAGNTGNAFSFGASNNNQQQPQQASPFGQQPTANTFGAPKPAGGLFGQAQPAASGGLFGQQQQQPATSGGLFGASNAAPAAVTQGTANITWQPTVQQEKDPHNNPINLAYQSISAMPALKGMSVEELRCQDYEQGRKSGNGGAGTSTGTGFGFGQQTPQSQPSGGLFGAQNNSGSTGAFGQQPQQQTGGIFGQQNQNQNQSTGLFGQQPQQQTGGLFGQPQQQQQPGQPAQSGGLFGQQSSQQPASGGFSFGAGTQQQQQQPSTGGFSFGAANNNAPKPGGLFGSSNTSNTGFGAPQQQQQQPSGSTGFSFGQNNQTQQNQQPGQTGTGFGGTSGFSFGANNAPKPATGGLFGAAQPSTSQSQTSFGGFGASNAGAAANKPAFSFGGTSGATSGGAFGSAPAPATGGLFGGTSQPTTTSQPAASGSLFGGFGQQNNQQQPQQQSNTFGGFGANNNSSTGGTGLFGANNNKPTGLFGTTTSQPTGQSGFGTSGTSGGFSFGATNNNNNQQQQQQQQKPGGLFGGSGATGTTGSNLFGSGNNTGGTSLFGQSNTGFSAPSGGLFGSSNNAGAGQGGLFGQSTAGGGAAQPSNFGASTGGLFGASGAQQQQQSSLPPQGAGLTSDPYGTDALFRSTTGGGAANQPSLPFNVSTNSASGQGPALSASLKSKPLPAPMMSPFRPNPKNASRIVRLRGGTPARDSSPSAASGGLFGRAASPALNGANGLFKGMSDDLGSPAGDGSLPHNAFVPRQSVKRLVLNDQGGANSSFGRSARAGTEDPNASSASLKESIFGNARSGSVAPRSSASAANRGVTFSPALEAGLGSSRRDLHTPATTIGGGVDESFGDSFNRSRSGLFNETPSKANNVLQANGRDLFGRSRKEAGAGSSAVGQGEPDVSLADLADGDYHLSPSLNALRRMAHAQLSRVQNFTVSRKGFGSVRYLVPVDLTSIQDLSIIPGGIVQLREKEIWVYPQREDLDSGLDGMKSGYERNPAPKAMQGEALNQPAEVALQRCWPLDKATRQPLTDAEHPRVKQHIAKLQKKGETRFVRFEPREGVWVFEVDHFSRYGLDEDSEDEDKANANPSQKTQGPWSDDEAPPPRRNLRAASRRRDAPPSLTSASSDEEDYIEEDAELASQASSGFMHDSELEGDKIAEPIWDVKESTPRATRFRSMQPRGLREGSVASSTGTKGQAASAAQNPPWAAQVGVEPRRAQVMQASFFGDRAPGIMEEKQARTPLDETETKRKFLVGVSARDTQRQTHRGDRLGRSDFSQAAAPAQHRSDRAEVLELADLAPVARKFTKIDLQNSITQGSDGVPVDAGLAFGRSFRVGWGPGGMLVHGGRIQGVLTPGDAAARNGSESATLRIEKAGVFNSEEEEKKQQVTSLQLLELQLAHSDIDDALQDDEGAVLEGPASYPHADLRFRDFADLYANGDVSHEALLWKLGVALFDEINLRLPPYSESGTVQTVTSIRRKAALSSWLRAAVSPTVEAEARGHIAAGRKAALTFARLTGHEIEKACCDALDAGDVRLATLLAQADGGDDETRADIAEQLAIWRNEGVDVHISKDHRRIYELLSGNVVNSAGTASRSVRDPLDRVDDLAIAHGLDWKRAFGLHLWYGTSHAASLTNAFERYEASVGGAGDTAPPLPPYREKSMGSLRLKELLKTGAYDKDALFQMIKLYSSSTFDLESALSPFGFGPVLADYRLPWHLYILLSRAMRKREFADRIVEVEGDTPVERNSARADRLTSDYAHQLELQGQWTWAAFVLLHLELPSSRTEAIKALLTRNVASLDDASHTFLTASLKIPGTWIYEAQAIAARHRDDRFGEFELLIKAQKFTAAHRIVVRHLAPEAIIRGDVDMILSLFSPFEHAFPNGLNNLPGWATGGQIYTDYVACLQQLPSLVMRAQDGQLDADAKRRLHRLAPRVTELLEDLPNLFKDCYHDDPDMELEDGRANLGQMVVLSDMTTALHNLARTLALHGLAPKTLDAWKSSVVPPEIEHVQNSANDYLDLVLV